MEVEVITDLFDYQPGQLTLGKDAFSLHFSEKELSLPADRLRTAVFFPSKCGGCRVELSSDAGQTHLFISRKEDTDKLAAALYALAGNTRRLEMILNGRDRQT